MCDVERQSINQGEI